MCFALMIPVFNDITAASLQHVALLYYVGHEGIVDFQSKTPLPRSCQKGLNLDITVHWEKYSAFQSVLSRPYCACCNVSYTLIISLWLYSRRKN